jgi:small subunit ribosomal protein S14
MTTDAQNAKYRKQMARLAASRAGPAEARMPPRERIRIKRRCNLCGRARAVYRSMASDGLIPGVKKASW